MANLLAWPENALRLKAKDPWPEVELLTEYVTEEDLIQKAIQLRPDIAAAEVRIQQADKQLSLAEKLAIPDVTAALAYNHDPQNTQSNFAGVTLSVPIPIFYRQQGEIGQAKVNLTSFRLDLNRAKHKLRAEIVSILAKLNAATLTTKRFESEIINKLDQIREAAELSYNKGKTSIIDLIEAERSHKAVMLDYYTALNNRTQFYVDLKMAVGEK